MDLKEKVILGLFGALLLVLLVATLGYGYVRHQAEVARVDLQNQLAAKDKTIQVKEGLFEKLTLQEKSVQSVLDSKDKQVQELVAQLKATDEQLQSATTVGLQWKKAYDGLANAQQSDGGVTVQPDGGVISRERVDFTENWGFIGASGYTLTNPPESYLKIEQLRPLTLTVALSQGPDKAWHSYVTSSEANVQATINLAAVNPYILAPKWYEKLAVRADLGVGSSQTGGILLLGAGLTFQVGSFDIGPAAWIIVNDHVNTAYGALFAWHPFMRAP